MSEYIVFADGAYRPSTDIGGIGVAFVKEDHLVFEYSRAYKGVTNNKMELAAVIIALRLIKKPIESLTICTDSEYVRGCATLGWQRKKNKKLWFEFDIQFERVKQLCSKIQILHVKGHQSADDFYSKWNNYVDRLAQQASQQLL